MKVLLAGSDEVWSLEKYYSRYLKDAGVQIAGIPVQSIFFGYYNKSIVNKVLFKLKLSRIGRVIDGKMRKMVEQYEPDMVWVFKGMELSPELLKWIKGKGIRLVNYNPDNPFLFSGR